MLIGLWLEMSSFQHTYACVMPRTFLPSCEILIPVLTADRISGLGSAVAVKVRSRNYFFQVTLSKVVFHQRLSSVKGCLPSKVVFLQGSSSIKGPLLSKLLFWKMTFDRV